MSESPKVPTDRKHLYKPPEASRDADSRKFKKPYQVVERPKVVENMNEEMVRDPPDNVTVPRDHGVWKARPVTSDPTDPQVPPDLDNAVGEGPLGAGEGATLGREKKIDAEVRILEGSDI